MTDVGTFADYPEGVVIKVGWHDNAMEKLVAAMRLLASDAAMRKQIGEAAHRYVVENHTWPMAASMYASVIEHTFQETRRALTWARRGGVAR